MTEAVSVTAVVVTYNRARDLETCLSGISEQSRPPDRVLVINNASTDETSSVLARFPGVDVIDLEANTGGAGGFSVATSEAVTSTADWLWLMDDDCRPDVDCLRELLRAIPADGSVGTVAPRVDYDNGDFLIGCSWPPRPVQSTGPIAWAPFIGPLISARAAAAIGPVDASFFIWQDDADYGIRLVLGGWGAVQAPAAIMRHPMPEAATGGNRFMRKNPHDLAPAWKAYYGTRNRRRIEQRLVGSPYAIAPHRALAISELKLATWLLLANPNRNGLTVSAMQLVGARDAGIGRMGIEVQPGPISVRDALRRLLSPRANAAAIRRLTVGRRRRPAVDLASPGLG